VEFVRDLLSIIKLQTIENVTHIQENGGVVAAYYAAAALR